MEKKVIKLELDVELVNTVLTGLAELPFRVSAAAIQEIQKQAAPQVQEEEAPAPAPKKA